jgi:predicted transglutaminase-like cysteine proteinase
MFRVQYILKLGLVAAALIGTAEESAGQTLAALPGSSLPTTAAGEARPILGWVKFCERHARECDVDTTEAASIALTPRLWQAIVSVNRRVNTTITPVTDQAHWGTPDSWDLPTDGSGDCEDYQLLKRKLLAEAGVPRRAMRMTVVIDERREGHAVLMVRTDRGDFILDNKTSAVLPWHETGYIFVKREGHDGPGWVSLGGAMSPTVTANR